MAGRRYLELLATLAIASTHQSQLGQDFEIYASQEFGLVELADAHSRASALMPQKKNPYALAAIRTQAGQAAGDVASALAALHTGSARTDHFHLLNGTVPRALDEAVAIARLKAVLAGIELPTRALRSDRTRELRHRRRRRRRSRADRRHRLPHCAQDRRPRGPRPRRRRRAVLAADTGPPCCGVRGRDRSSGRDRRSDDSGRTRSAACAAARRRRGRRRRQRWTRCSTGVTRLCGAPELEPDGTGARAAA